MVALSATIIFLTLYLGFHSVSNYKYSLKQQKAHHAIDHHMKQKVAKNHELHQEKKHQRAQGRGNPFYKIHALDINGQIVDMSRYRKKTVMIVNVASHDSKTKQYYAQMQSLYEKYNPHGLEILAFPCNQFGGEEAGTNKEIQRYTQQHFRPEFTLMSKINVNGPESIPLYRMLKASFPGAIKWNFGAIFLIDASGRVVKRSRLAPSQLEPVLVDLLKHRRLTPQQAGRD